MKQNKEKKNEPNVCKEVNKNRENQRKQSPMCEEQRELGNKDKNPVPFTVHKKRRKKPTSFMMIDRVVIYSSK